MIRGQQAPARAGPPAGHMMAGRVDKAKNPRVTLMRLGRYLLAWKYQLVLVAIFVVLGTILSIIGPYLLGVAIERY
ncbi:hypothetical protein MUP05_09490, partial [Candidatus Bathyarchaeota archaeon]|nr:hypothetical protein [Candidatus Bathyarchaeota archaeon]